MDFRTHTTLGRTGLSVSRLGIASGYDAPSEAVERAFHEHDINTFYWGARRKSEFGNALKNLCRNNRDRTVVIFQTFDRSGFLMRRFHEKGLRHLSIDCADILILGWANKEPQGRWLETAIRLKEEGKVKFLCVSSHKLHVLGALAAGKNSPFDVLMVRYNAVHPGAEHNVFSLLPKEDPPGIMTYTATCWGQLLQSSKMPAGEESLTAADCYRFSLTNPNVNLCMMGPKTAGELEEGVKALKLGPLSDDEMVRARMIGNYIHQK